MGINYKNAFINYEIKGEGDTLVLLHGFAESLNIWNHFSEELSRDYKVITIDLPGHGKSECISGIHSMELMAEVVKHVLNHLNILHAVIVGHSMGGYVALAFMKYYPQLVKGIGLFHSSSLADNEEAIERRTRNIEILKNNHSSFLINFIPELFAPENQNTFDSEIKELINQARQMSPEALIAAQQGMKNRFSTLDVLINSTLPVMFIAGQKDSKVPFENIWVQMALTEAAFSLILRSAGHMGFLEEAKKTLEFTRSFTRTCFLD
jgi:pimeloyl-ACP methyl ester carboxylesterase